MDDADLYVEADDCRRKRSATWAGPKLNSFCGSHASSNGYRHKDIKSKAGSLTSGAIAEPSIHY